MSKEEQIQKKKRKMDTDVSEAGVLIDRMFERTSEELQKLRAEATAALERLGKTEGGDQEVVNPYVFSTAAGSESHSMQSKRLTDYVTETQNVYLEESFLQIRGALPSERNARP